MNSLFGPDFRKLIEESKGRFSIKFVKRSDGTVREMVAQYGVKKHLKGGPPAYDPKGYMLVTVYDVVKKGYRSIPLEGIIELKTGGRVYRRDSYLVTLARNHTGSFNSSVLGVEKSDVSRTPGIDDSGINRLVTVWASSPSEALMFVEQLV